MAEDEPQRVSRMQQGLWQLGLTLCNGACLGVVAGWVSAGLVLRMKRGKKL